MSFIKTAVNAELFKFIFANSFRQTLGKNRFPLFQVCVITAA